MIYGLIILVFAICIIFFVSFRDEDKKIEKDINNPTLTNISKSHSYERKATIGSSMEA